ncbi:hypothetical protein AVEN_266590-1 [Araneus ventricosus]|uniref:Uncharacterized protein n=1 Tax=Araneus ventricosus TaxID=182803 RepID=A0A4Y2W6S1_ARAVE|nr:hypothetical protein AVEN_266590-1 [Araneus ventricosus]
MPALLFLPPLDGLHATPTGLSLFPVDTCLLFPRPHWMRVHLYSSQSVSISVLTFFHHVGLHASLLLFGYPRPFPLMRLHLTSTWSLLLSVDACPFSSSLPWMRFHLPLLWFFILWMPASSSSPPLVRLHVLHSVSVISVDSCLLFLLVE